MPRSTVHASDSKSHNSDNDDWQKSPIKEESGAEADNDSEEEREEVIFITQDRAVWSLEEPEILCPFKDEWMEYSLTEQGDIAEQAVKELLALHKQDPGPLWKKVKTWLRRKVKKWKTFGPGKAPSLHTVVSWYKDFELPKYVKEKHRVIPRDKMWFIGLWKMELRAMVNDLKTNPANKKELKKMEDRSTQWTEKGPPPNKRKW